MKIYIDPTLLKMPQVRSITYDICDGIEYFPISAEAIQNESWALAWGYPVTKRRFGVAETGFFWDAMHIDTIGLYQFSSLNTAEAFRLIHEYSPPESTIDLINSAPFPKSKYRQPLENIEWDGVVFASQNPSDRSIHSVASTEDWWRFYEDCCKYYGAKLFVKLHPWNNNEVEDRIRSIARSFGCQVGKAGHSLIQNCEHVVLFNSTFAIDCMVRGVPVKQGAPGYFWQTGAVSYCHGDPTKTLNDTKASALQLIDFLAWRYCFSMDCNLCEWKARLSNFANSHQLFPLDESQSYAAYLKKKCIIQNKLS